MKVIASGGISSFKDVKELKEKGLFGLIIGRALYEGKISLERALAIGRGEENERY
jgi:phosphoribosylformimino-5-aminoimidazole carboxamide ribotide isomerase